MNNFEHLSIGIIVGFLLYVLFKNKILICINNESK